MNKRWKILCKEEVDIIIMYESYLSTNTISKFLSKKFPHVLYDIALLYIIWQRASVVRNVVTHGGLNILVEFGNNINRKGRKFSCNIDSVTGNLKCINIKPPLMVIYASRYGYFILTEKTF